MKFVSRTSVVVVVVCPDFKFRYDDQELNSLIEEYKENLKIYDNTIKKNKKQSSLHKELVEKWKTFLRSYPNIKYKEIVDEISKNQDIVEKILESHELIDLDVRKMKSKEDSLINVINKEKVVLENTNSALAQLNTFRYKYEKKKDLTKQIIAKKSIIEQNRLKLLEIEEKLSELNSKENMISVDIRKTEERLKELDNNIRFLHASYSEKVTISSSEIEKYIADKTFDGCWKLFLDIKKQYDHIINESELKQIILGLKDDLAQLKQQIDTFCNNQKISIEDNEFIKLYGDNLSYEQILERKKAVEFNLGELRNRISELKTQKKNINKENISLANEFNIEDSNLQTYYKDIIQKKSLIREELEDLQKEFEECKENLFKITSFIFKLAEDLKELSQNKNLLKTLENATDSNLLRIIDLRISDKLTIQKESDLEIDSAADLNSLISTEQKKLEEIMFRRKTWDKKTESFIIKVKSLNEKVIKNLEDIRLKDFINEFNLQHVSELSSYINKMNKRLEQINECIKAPKERLSNIVKIYSTIVDDIITKIINLQKVKLPMPEISHLNNRQIIKIPISARDEVAGTVENYFREIFEYNIKFPSELTKSEIINTIIKNYLQIRMKTIKFLFPEKSFASYEPITKLIKSSGGEKLTVAVMLYCLIAHYRMKYLGVRTRNISYPLIMDDPIGTASRADLISMQVSLAKHLNIQLIAFTHVPEVEALHQYYNFITLKRSVYRNSKFQIEVENEEEPQILEGGFVKIRPKMVPYFKKLDSYLGDRDQSEIS